MGVFIFIKDVFDSFINILGMWRDKEEKILIKIICTIILLGFLIGSAKIWL